MPGSAGILRGRDDRHVADGLQDLRERRNAGGMHAVVVADKDSVRRRLPRLLGRRRNQQTGGDDKREKDPGSLHDEEGVSLLQADCVLLGGTS